MKETVVTWVDGNKYSADMSCGEFTISSKKTDKGSMKPPEMILASLGTCGGLFLKPVLKEMGIEWDDFKLSLSWEKAKAPKLFKKINMHYEIEAEISPEKLEEALEESHRRCLVMNTLDSDIEIETTFEIK